MGFVRFRPPIAKTKSVIAKAALFNAKLSFELQSDLLQN